MEPVGFAIGIAGLAGTFTACVDCYEYIQLGRNFGHDYGKCLLRLDAAKVRMTRWGASVGLGAETQPLHQIALSEANTQRLHHITITEAERDLAKSLLEQILATFNEVKERSERFKRHMTVKRSGLDDLVLYDANTDLDPEYRRLHLTMSQLALKRQKKTNLLTKTTWALYEKRRFDALINDITGFVGELVELFPAALNDQESLCKMEVSAIQETQDLALLKVVIGDDDQMLEGVVNKEMESRGHSFTDWKIDGGSKLWAGDDNAFGVASKSHHFNKFSVSGNADVRLGNVNRGN